MRATATARFSERNCYGVLSATQNAGALHYNGLAKRPVQRAQKVPKPASRDRDLEVKPIQRRAAYMDRCTRGSHKASKKCFQISYIRLTITRAGCQSRRGAKVPA